MDDLVSKRARRLTVAPLFPFAGTFGLKELQPLMEAELYGRGNVLWSQLLPPLAQSEIDANHAGVIAAFTASLDGPA